VARASELIDFRRAFWWLLGGVLLPSVALVAFGVVAVTNERAAVERRLADEYGVKLRLVESALLGRLEQSAESELGLLRSGADGFSGAVLPANVVRDPLARPALPIDPATPPPALTEATHRAALLPDGGHLFTTVDSGDRHTFLLLRTTTPGHAVALFFSELDLAAVARELPALAASIVPRDRASFKLTAPLDKASPLDTLRRLVFEVAPAKGTESRATVARLPLDPPLDGFLLAAERAGDDPVSALAFRNRTYYVALLMLLYTSIGTGFGLTLRELYRGAKLSRLKTDFVANISHELRTPLTSVRLFAETLQSGRATSPEEVKECLTLLSSEAERLSLLVEKLLDWSQLESGSRVLRKERTSIPELLANVNQIFRAQQLGASYSTELEANLPAVLIDRDAMAQVVLNLLHNAVKYTPEEKQIVLRAKRIGGKVALEVEDNGPGVRSHDKKRIFERFYRVDDLLSRRTEGTGLGLAIAKRIVEWHGGKIDLETRLGVGSIFRVLLPAQEGAKA
jgi:two-component system phosphate regulon sensor histidine kinase PhoR